MAVFNGLRYLSAVTRFYRPPELLLGAEYYNWTVDIWSAGCVLGEMIRGSVLFPGRHRKHQLKLIFLCIGSPTAEDVKVMRVPTEIIFDGYVVVGTGLGMLCPNADPHLIGILSKILVYPPKDRLHGRELLLHPAFDSILQTGAKRSNGQVISTIITADDVKDVQNDTGNKPAVITVTTEMRKQLNFTCDELKNKIAPKNKAMDKRKTSFTIREASKITPIRDPNTILTSKYTENKA